jgi:hypothetical protein
MVGKNIISVLFETPDGQAWIASYRNDGKIICHQVGVTREYTFEQFHKVHPNLMDRVKKQLEKNSC